jgi:hypothetical protein
MTITDPSLDSEPRPCELAAGSVKSSGVPGSTCGMLAAGAHTDGAHGVPGAANRIVCTSVSEPVGVAGGASSSTNTGAVVVEPEVVPMRTTARLPGRKGLQRRAARGWGGGTWARGRGAARAKSRGQGDAAAHAGSAAAPSLHDRGAAAAHVAAHAAAGCFNRGRFLAAGGHSRASGRTDAHGQRGQARGARHDGGRRGGAGEAAGGANPGRKPGFEPVPPVPPVTRQKQRLRAGAAAACGCGFAAALAQQSVLAAASGGVFAPPAGVWREHRGPPRTAGPRAQMAAHAWLARLLVVGTSQCVHGDVFRVSVIL